MKINEMAKLPKKVKRNDYSFIKPLPKNVYNSNPRVVENDVVSINPVKNG